MAEPKGKVVGKADEVELLPLVGCSLLNLSDFILHLFELLVQLVLVW